VQIELANEELRQRITRELAAATSVTDSLHLGSK
jgi:hypothetical protein